MLATSKCPTCGGEVREGELFIRIYLSASMASQPINPVQNPTLGGEETSALGSSDLRFTTGQSLSHEGPLWREYTGIEKGWLRKRKETETFSIKGMRCVECGYIRLYVNKKK